MATAETPLVEQVPKTHYLDLLLGPDWSVRYRWPAQSAILVVRAARSPLALSQRARGGFLGSW